MVSAYTSKIIAIITTVLCGLLGLVLYPITRSLEPAKLSLYISYVNALSSGTILSVGLMHLIAESVETLGELYEYPFALLMALSGFAFLYLTEDVILPAFLKKQKSPVLNAIHHIDTSISKSNCSSSCSECAVRETDKGYNDLNITSNDTPEMRLKQLLFTAGLMVALLVHSFFAGLSMGIEDEMEDVVITLVAVALHKSLASVVLCNSLLASGTSIIYTVLLMLLFSSCTPIGVGAGMAVSTNVGDHLDKIGAFLQSFCGGNFLFLAVTILKMQPKTVDGVVPNPLFRFGLWTLGATVMAVVAIWT